MVAALIKSCTYFLPIKAKLLICTDELFGGQIYFGVKSVKHSARCMKHREQRVPKEKLKTENKPFESSHSSVIYELCNARP